MVERGALTHLNFNAFVELIFISLIFLQTCRIFDDEDVFEDELSRSLHDAWSPCVVDDLFYEVEVLY